MRHTDEVKFRFVGSREECIKYISDARKVLGMLRVRDRELGGLDIAYRRVTLPNGVVIEAYDNNTLPVLTIYAGPPTGQKSPPPKAYDMRFAWRAEGIVFTPVSDTYPDGFGLPTRDYETGEVVLDPRGTEAGVWPQVILNRFANNKYLDKWEHIAGLETEIIESIVPENPLLRATWDALVATEGFSVVLPFGLRYNPREHPYDVLFVDDGLVYWADPENQTAYPQVPGVYFEGVLLYPQFGSYLNDDLIFEVEGQEWVVHRPEEVLYLTAGQEGVFQHTNTIRDALGYGRMHRMVRGHANLANFSVNEVALSGLQWHDNEAFRPGYRTLEAKARAGSSYAADVGENLLIGNMSPGTFVGGVAAATEWENSPTHYAIMSAESWTDEEVPGAEHFVGATPATVTESELSGIFTPPATGYEWAQVFTRQITWVPAPLQYHYAAGEGAAGTFGMVNEYARDAYYGPSYLFVCYAGDLYAIPNELFEARALSVQGCAAYTDPVDGELKLRAVVCTSDYAADQSPDLQDIADFELHVVTFPVRVVDEGDWLVEKTESFTRAAGYIPVMQAGVKFSPDGSKFVFTLPKEGESYSEALDFEAENFTTERSFLANPRYSVAPAHIEYDSGTGMFSVDVVVMPLALVDAGTVGVAGSLGHRSSYIRTLSGSAPLFVDYDDEGSLIYATIHVQEYSYQEYIDEGVSGENSYENYCYRIRYLEFPSGKRVYTMQQWLRNYESITDLVEMEVAAFPMGDMSGESFFSMIHHINVRHEDIVYTKRGSQHDLYFRTGATYPQWYEHGPTDIIFDGGWDEVDPVTSEVLHERIQEVLFHQDDQYYTDADIVPAYTEFEAGVGHYGLKMDTSAGVYQMDVTPGLQFLSFVGFNVRPMVGVPAPWIGITADAATNPELLKFPGYNGESAWVVDHIIGRPPFENYRVSALVGLEQRFPLVYGDISVSTGNGIFLGSSALLDKSYLTTNICPIMLTEHVSVCQVVRYRDRVMLRLENRLWPWPGQGEFHFTGGFVPDSRTPIIGNSDNASEVATDWSILPDGADLIVWANFDIDEAVGMSDVTDIQPFGRAG